MSYLTIVGWKDVGESMLQATMRECERFNLEGKIAYSGKLDPLAQGAFLITNDTQYAEKLHFMDKIYQYQIIVNAPITDSNDILGLIKFPTISVANIDRDSIVTTFVNKTGKIQQRLNRFSAKRIEGKPCWQWSQEGRFDEIKNKMPVRTINIFDTSFQTEEEYSGEQIKEIILNKVAKLKEYNNLEFRQDEIIEQWTTFQYNSSYSVLTFQSTVSSGTYIRQHVKDIGKKLGIPMIVLQITRLKFVKIPSVQ